VFVLYSKFKNKLSSDLRTDSQRRLQWWRHTIRKCWRL